MRCGTKVNPNLEECSSCGHRLQYINKKNKIHHEDWEENPLQIYKHAMNIEKSIMFGIGANALLQGAQSIKNPRKHGKIKLKE